MISYLPKATVQAAIGSVPLSLGLPCGRLILSIAVLSILITAPLGAFGMELSCNPVAKTAALNHLEFRACLVFFCVQRYNLWLEKHAAWAAERRHAMTKIDIFSGFLGAGKTTLIQKADPRSICG